VNHLMISSIEITNNHLCKIYEIAEQQIMLYSNCASIFEEEKHLLLLNKYSKFCFRLNNFKKI